MNPTATTARLSAAVAPRATALAGAVIVTLALLGGIDGLALQQHAATELAQASQVEPVSSQTAQTAATAVAMAPRS